VAENSLLRIARTGPTAAHRRREDQRRRRNLRIAIRQLDRADLYLVALYSLDIADEGIESAVDDLIRDVRGLREHLMRARLSA
jgi:hypothetical protein